MASATGRTAGRRAVATTLRTRANEFAPKRLTATKSAVADSDPNPRRRVSWRHAPRRANGFNQYRPPVHPARRPPGNRPPSPASPSPAPPSPTRLCSRPLLLLRFVH